MKTLLQRIVFVLFVSLVTHAHTASAQDPPTPKQEEGKVIGGNVDFTCTIEISGIIIEKDESTFMGKPMKTIVQKVTTSLKGGAWVPKTENKELSKKVTSTIQSIFNIKMFSKKLDIPEKPPEHPTIANFTLYVACHSSGDVKYSAKQGVYYDEYHSQRSGMAKISYTSLYNKTPTPEIAYEAFYKLIRAFNPLAKQLGCNAIWIRTTGINPKTHEYTGKTGVIWNNGWCQVVPTSTRISQ